MTNDKLDTSLAANSIKAKLTNHISRTTLVTPTTDKHYSLPPGSCYSEEITLARLACLVFLTIMHETIVSSGLMSCFPMFLVLLRHQEDL